MNVDNVWQQYGSGLWTEPWSTSMREFVAAIQPYAHYGRSLAQWQYRIHRIYDATEEDTDLKAVLELTPRAYDPQQETRITLFHALLSYTLGRIWIAANAESSE